MPKERAWETERNVTSSPSSRILPSSGRWKPVIVLSRVLLPAPLSPISPSTSPSLTCRSTPLRTDTAPKFLTTPSTRRKSEPFVEPFSIMPPLRRATLLRRRKYHCDQDGDAQDDVVSVGAYALQGEAVAEDGEDQRPEESARNGPDPT